MLVGEWKSNEGRCQNARIKHLKRYVTSLTAASPCRLSNSERGLATENETLLASPSKVRAAMRRTIPIWGGTVPAIPARKQSFESFAARSVIFGWSAALRPFGGGCRSMLALVPPTWLQSSHNQHRNIGASRLSTALQKATFLPKRGRARLYEMGRALALVNGHLNTPQIQPPLPPLPLSPPALRSDTDSEVL